LSSDRIAGLDEALSLLAGAGGPHRVAWLDLLGSTPVRGVVTRADSVLSAPGRGIAVRARLTVPERWPAGLLRPEVVRAYNAYRFHRAPGHAVGEVETFGAHMFPLDALGAWPRLYGAAGLVQYQFAVPTGAEHALEQVIGRVRRSGVPCYLAVLKDLGPANAAPLSFPLAGWTLALDLPGAAPGLDALLDACDEVVAEAGGRVYLAKDGRTRADVLAAMYPRLDEWRATRDRIDPERLWVSDLGLRAGLVPR
jgi:decaprenylphospho-beta-D-ribofuranose 2-oxidase